jgi:hypothetical protein
MTKSTYLKILGGLIAGGFGITLAVLIGNRLSTEAMAVLAGAVCGVGAAIPTSLLIIAVTQRRRHTETTQAPQQQFTQPVVFALPQAQPPAPTPLPATWDKAPIQRHFHVVGDAGMGEEEQ